MNKEFEYGFWNPKTIKEEFIRKAFMECFYLRERRHDGIFEIYKGKREQTKFFFREFVESITEQEIKDYLDLNMRKLPLGFENEGRSFINRDKLRLGRPINYEEIYSYFFEYIKERCNV